VGRRGGLAGCDDPIHPLRNPCALPRLTRQNPVVPTQSIDCGNQFRIQTSLDTPGGEIVVVALVEVIVKVCETVGSPTKDDDCIAMVCLLC